MINLVNELDLKYIFWKYKIEIISINLNYKYNKFFNWKINNNVT